MATVNSVSQVGPLVREWRERRRLTQMELALDAGVSTRHLSFVETGRSKPGRALLLKILARLEVPLRDQNEVLLVAGHAPAFPEHPLRGPELAPVREALDQILAGHEPYPAIVIDSAWNLVAANSTATALAEGVDLDPALLAPPVNAVRVSLHPRGLAPVIVNVGAWRAFFRERLERQLAITGDDRLAALIEELDGYPAAPDQASSGALAELPGPLKVRGPNGGELSFFSMFATFDFPFDVTTSELAVELLFPADRATAETLENLHR
jgi:transcriptional regulator with XRE-family HTH domain